MAIFFAIVLAGLFLFSTVGVFYSMGERSKKLPKPHTSGGSRKRKGTHWFFASFNPSVAGFRHGT
jgi:hypothetical protein